MSKELAGYLQRLTLEGERESHGSFTIDHRKALEKLSTRLFADPHAYLLKLVQSAVASGAEAVDLRSYRDRLEVHFRSETFTSEGMAGLEEMLRAPLGSQAEPATAHFLRGLHAARARPFPSLGWAVCDQNGGVGYLFHQDGFQRRELSGRPGPGTDCVFSIQAGPAMRWADEMAVLSSRCSLSAVPIRWDNRPLGPRAPALGSTPLLDRLYLSQVPHRELLAVPHLTELKALLYDLGGGSKDFHSYGSTILHQWRGYRSTPQHSLFEVPDVPDLKIVESDFSQEVLGIPASTYALNHGMVRPGRLEGSNNFYQILYVHDLDRYTTTPDKFSQGRFGKRPTLCLQAWLRCPAQPQASSRLQVLQHGVMLDALELELPLPGLVIFLADNNWPCDLSGLVPLQGERFRDARCWLTEEVGRARKELRQVLRWGDAVGLAQNWLDAVQRLHRLDAEDQASESPGGVSPAGTGQENPSASPE